MADIFSKSKRSEIMRAIRSHDTKPEIRVRKHLHSKGYRYSLHNKRLPGKPDITLSKHKVVIFVNGCFWHAHNCSIGSGRRKPNTNRRYWANKISKTVERDKINMKKLSAKGWNVLVIWECETNEIESIESNLSELFQR